MTRLLTILMSVFLLPISLCAQESGSITPQVLGELERSCMPDAGLRAAQHAVAQVDGRKVTQSWEKIVAVDTFFTLRLDGQRITNQEQTGRCWMFSGLNILRPIAAKKLNCNDLELSQNYLYFYEKLERANLFLEAIIQTKDKPYTDRLVEYLLRTHVNDWGNWVGFVELVRKYGIVPQEIMPETYSSSHSDYVVGVLGLRLKRAAVEIRHASVPDSIPLIKTAALQDVYRILAINFGLPPKEFQWRYMQQDTTLTTHPTCTPREFCQEVIGDALDEYYPIYSVPTLPFDRKYEIDLDRTVSDQPNMYFVNCPLPLMKELAKQSLLDSTVVWFGCDVGQESSAEYGLMIPDLYDYASLYGMDFTLSRRDRFETYSSVPNHNMVFTGIDLDGDKVRKWLVENSWGDKKGKQGFFLMLDEWFDRYVQVVVLRKKYIPGEILALFETKPEILPPWDPMVSSARIR